MKSTEERPSMALKMSLLAAATSMIAKTSRNTKKKQLT
jgi:hypothetical protein